MLVLIYECPIKRCCMPSTAVLLSIDVDGDIDIDVDADVE